MRMKRIALLVLATVLICVSFSSAFAENENTNEPFAPTAPELDFEILEPTIIEPSGLVVTANDIVGELDTDELAHLASGRMTRAAGTIGDIGNVTNELIPDDPYDVLYWPQTDTKLAWFKVTSTNPSYYATLGVVTSTGGIALTNLNIPLNQLVNVEIGPVLSGYAYWCVVIQTGAFGGEYRFDWNKASSPDKMGRLYYASPTLDKMISIGTDKSTLYLNGSPVLSLTDNNSALNWERYWSRDLYGPYGGYERRTVNVSEVKLIRDSADYPVCGGVYKYVAKDTNAAEHSANYGFFAQFTSGTLYSHYYVYYEPGPNGTTRITDTDDYLLVRSPHRVNDILHSYDDHYLVIDCERNKPVDMYTPLNMFYSAGQYNLPDIFNLP